MKRRGATLTQNADDAPEIFRTRNLFAVFPKRPQRRFDAQSNFPKALDEGDGQLSSFAASLLCCWRLIPDRGGCRATL
jgi:hypothetical protein